MSSATLLKTPVEPPLFDPALVIAANNGTPIAVLFPKGRWS
ncbi:hypothetical protein [Labrenzia sp. THAF82]|nr:hypothetical protein [Labrenzia sp. THAF82]